MPGIFNRPSRYTANTFGQQCHAAEGTYTRIIRYDVRRTRLQKIELFFYQARMAARSQQREFFGYVPDATVLALTPANVQAWFNAYGKQTFKFLEHRCEDALCRSFRRPSLGPSTYPSGQTLTPHLGTRWNPGLVICRRA